jgi:head-tail adaptor
VRAGKLDRRIKLQSGYLEGDGDHTTEQWNTVAEVYAQQMDRSQMERFVSEQTLATAVRGYRIRYRTDVTPTWRVEDEYADLWRVDGVAEGAGRRTETVLLCSRYDPNERVYE